MSFLLQVVELALPTMGCGYVVRDQRRPLGLLAAAHTYETQTP